MSENPTRPYGFPWKMALVLSACDESQTEAENAMPSLDAWQPARWHWGIFRPMRRGTFSIEYDIGRALDEPNRRAEQAVASQGFVSVYRCNTMIGSLSIMFPRLKFRDADLRCSCCASTKKGRRRDVVLSLSLPPLSYLFAFAIPSFCLEPRTSSLNAPLSGRPLTAV